MNKIEINHHEIDTFILGLLVFPFLILLFFASVFGFAETETDKNIAIAVMLIGYLIIFLLAFAFDYVFCKRNITVEYDSDKIIYKPIFKEKTIMLADITSIYYTVYEEYQGRGVKKQRLELNIITEEEKFFLNDETGKEYIKYSVSKSGNTPELIKLYNFIADIYPEKAEGYKEDE